MMATQQDAALVAAMARQALEDAGLIEGAGLARREAEYCWDAVDRVEGREN